MTTPHAAIALTHMSQPLRADPSMSWSGPIVVASSAYVATIH